MMVVRTLMRLILENGSNCPSPGVRLLKSQITTGIARKMISDNPMLSIKL